MLGLRIYNGSNDDGGGNGGGEGKGYKNNNENNRIRSDSAIADVEKNKFLNNDRKNPKHKEYSRNQNDNSLNKKQLQNPQHKLKIKGVYPKCVCEEGYEGVRCEIKVDWCGKGVCYGGSTCINLANQFKCLCPPGFTGALCDVPLTSCQLQAQLQG